jgi:pimeloyl-ACP methyl ester carboxylesterase
MMLTSSASPTPARPWFRYIVLSLLTFFLLLAVAGISYQFVSVARDRRAHPMPGQLIDVGGYKLHIDCAGQGTPTVILDSGLGDSYISWQKVQPRISQFTRVCSYDRAGLGYSDSTSRPRTSKVMAEELHALLRNSGVTGPIVLVGHSLGGYNVRLYASLYRDDVAGMILVDASHPDQTKRFPPAINDMEGSWVREAEFLEFAMPLSIPRVLGFCSSDAAARAAECNFSNAREGVAEMKSFPESAAQAAATGSLGDLPLAVISHDPDTPQPDLPADLVKPTNDAWEQMQEELARLSTKGSQTIARGSGHYIQIDRPDVVVDAVYKIVNQARTAPVADKPPSFAPRRTP